MKSFFFVVPPLAGHTNPTVSVGRALSARGHRVAWLGHAQAIRGLLDENAELLPLDDADSSRFFAELLEKGRGLRGLSSLQFLWQEMLIPLARRMLPRVTAILERQKPDVVIVDQQALAGGLSARRLSLRWATFSTTPAALLDPFAALPKVGAWKAEQLESLQREAGLSPVAEPDLSPELVVVFSIQELVARAASPFDELAGTVPPMGGARSWPPRFRFVGPAFQDRPERTRFPWEKLRERPRILVSLGTVNASDGEAFYRALVEAMRDVPVEVIVAAPPRCVPDAPDRFVVQDRVPQLALMPHVDLVVCHAGHNTVCEALAHGVPLVLAPIRDDQSMVAEPVARAGAAVRVRYGRLSSQALRQAITTVLGDHQFRTNAEGIGRSLRDAGGAHAAATLLEALA